MGLGEVDPEIKQLTLKNSNYHGPDFLKNQKFPRMLVVLFSTLTHFAYMLNLRSFWHYHREFAHISRLKKLHYSDIN